MKQSILIKDIEVTVVETENGTFLSLSDMAKAYGGKDFVNNWMRLKSTFDFLGTWELLNNPNFNFVEFDEIRKDAGSNTFTFSPKQWRERLNGMGIVSRVGRYDSGVFAHEEWALEFASWLDPVFKVYFLKEFKRLKEEESTRLKEKIQWSVRRELSKINYYIQTDAIQKNIIPNFNLPLKNQGVIYASEADLLNKVVFDMTASEWRNQNADKSGNIRDHASDIQLTILSNLESHNAELIKQGLQQEERIEILERIAQEQLEVLFEKQQREVFKKLKKGN
jgi:KilA-N domain